MPKGSHHSSKTHCAKGHEYTPENTRIVRTQRGTPARQCRACYGEKERRNRIRGVPHNMVAWRKANPGRAKEIRAAHDAVSYALKVGKLAKPKVCGDCGAEKKLTAHHHKGYAKEHRLDVVWLCSLCHEKADAETK